MIKVGATKKMSDKQFTSLLLQRAKRAFAEDLRPAFGERSSNPRSPRFDATAERPIGLGVSAKARPVRAIAVEPRLRFCSLHRQPDSLYVERWANTLRSADDWNDNDDPILGSHHRLWIVDNPIAEPAFDWLSSHQPSVPDLSTIGRSIPPLRMLEGALETSETIDPTMLTDLAREAIAETRDRDRVLTLWRAKIPHDRAAALALVPIAGSLAITHGRQVVDVLDRLLAATAVSDADAIDLLGGALVDVALVGAPVLDVARRHRSTLTRGRRSWPLLRRML